MLKKLILHNFKSHKSTELNFDNSRLHGLVGKNSAGKTSVLQALHYLSMLADSSFEKIFEYGNSFYNFKGLEFAKSRFEGKIHPVFYCHRRPLPFFSISALSRLSGFI